MQVRYARTMKRNHLTKHIVYAICQLSILWLFISGTARGSTLNWTNIAGGSWNVATNWDPNQVPAAGDTAIITKAGNYTVSMDANYYPFDKIVLAGGAGGQTLAMSGSQIACSATITVGSGGSLTASQAFLQAPQINIFGTLTWSGGGSISALVNVAT